MAHLRAERHGRIDMVRLCFPKWISLEVKLRRLALVVGLERGVLGGSVQVA
jgi:hypothetical protein